MRVKAVEVSQLEVVLKDYQYGTSPKKQAPQNHVTVLFPCFCILFVNLS
jgi:hypothetical protein